eukprot:13056340-Alexandrium_andersonii.AAC.1
MPHNSEDERFVQAPSGDVHMASPERRPRPSAAQPAAQERLEAPLRAHPTMATPLPAASSGLSVPEADDPDPVGGANAAGMVAGGLGGPGRAGAQRLVETLDAFGAAAALGRAPEGAVPLAGSERAAASAPRP